MPVKSMHVFRGGQHGYCPAAVGREVRRSHRDASARTAVRQDRASVTV